MEPITINNKLLSFPEWAKLVKAQKGDILKIMLESDKPLDRIIAKDILKTAGGGEND
jgi:hypothetical protein